MAYYGGLQAESQQYLDRRVMVDNVRWNPTAVRFWMLFPARPEAETDLVGQLSVSTWGAAGKTS